jgi:hypothetical protein
LPWPNLHRTHVAVDLAQALGLEELVALHAHEPNNESEGFGVHVAFTTSTIAIETETTIATSRRRALSDIEHARHVDKVMAIFVLHSRNCGKRYATRRPRGAVKKERPGRREVKAGPKAWWKCSRHSGGASNLNPQ